MQDIVHPSDFAAYNHSRIMTAADLKLLDRSIAGQRRIGLNENVLLAGPRTTYTATRAWAEAIHAAFSEAQGLHYQSYQFGPRYAVVLFGDRVAKGSLVERAVRPGDVVIDPFDSEAAASTENWLSFRPCGRNAPS